MIKKQIKENGNDIFIKYTDENFEFDIIRLGEDTVYNFRNYGLLPDYVKVNIESNPLDVTIQVSKENAPVSLSKNTMLLIDELISFIDAVLVDYYK